MTSRRVGRPCAKTAKPKTIKIKIKKEPKTIKIKIKKEPVKRTRKPVRKPPPLKPIKIPPKVKRTRKIVRKPPPIKKLILPKDLLNIVDQFADRKNSTNPPLILIKELVDESDKIFYEKGRYGNDGRPPKRRTMSNKEKDRFMKIMNELNELGVDL
jgi:hypothetical protein